MSYKYDGVSIPADVLEFPCSLHPPVFKLLNFIAQKYSASFCRMFFVFFKG
jgi:hypothetical protein